MHPRVYFVLRFINKFRPHYLSVPRSTHITPHRRTCVSPFVPSEMASLWPSGYCSLSARRSESVSLQRWRLSGLFMRTCYMAHRASETSKRPLPGSRAIEAFHGARRATARAFNPAIANGGRQCHYTVYKIKEWKNAAKRVNRPAAKAIFVVYFPNYRQRQGRAACNA